MFSTFLEKNYTNLLKVHFRTLWKLKRYFFGLQILSEAIRNTGPNHCENLQIQKLNSREKVMSFSHKY